MLTHVYETFMRNNILRSFTSEEFQLQLAYLVDIFQALEQFKFGLARQEY